MSEIHLLKAQVAHTVMYIGPMYSGKTSELKRKIDQYRRFTDVPTITLKHQQDTRHASEGEITTHSGDNRPAYPCGDLLEFLKSPLYQKSTVIFLDEGHFFEGQGLTTFVRRVITDKKILYMASLDSDYIGRPFSEVLSLIPMMDEVQKFQAACDQCRMPACHSYRPQSKKRKRMDPGGSAEGYQSLCHRCFQESVESEHVSCGDLM